MSPKITEIEVKNTEGHFNCLNGQVVIKTYLSPLTKGVLFHKDNAPAHKSGCNGCCGDCGFELIDHPPYFPDMAPSDYFLFRNMKKHLAGSSTDDEVISAVEDFFEYQDDSLYTT